MADIPQYPMMFSADQWLNKFSPFSGRSIPFPATYLGPPTDAHGNPIQSYLDTQAAHDAWAAANPAPQAAPVTLNTNPTNPDLQRQRTVGMQPSQLFGGNAAAAATSSYPSLAPMDTLQRANALGGLQPSGQPYPTRPGSNFGTDALLNRQFAAFGSGPMPSQQAAPVAAAPTNPYDMNQAYLNALANPGKVQTPGATVAQAPAPSNQSGVLQQFLANWNKGGGQTKGAGNYDNRGFFDALKGMV